MKLKLIGKRRISGTSKNNVPYDFWELHFLNQADKPGLEGFSVIRAVAQNSVNVPEYPINKEYDVAIYMKGDKEYVNMMYPFEK